MDRTVKGVLGQKLGMTQVWDENNRVVPVTVVKAGPCVVTQVRTPDHDGYSAVQLGFGAVDPRRVNKPDAGHFAKAGVAPRRHLVELRTSDASEYTLGQEVGADAFAENPSSPFKELIPPSLDDIRVDIELRGKLCQRLLALHSGKRHLRLEGRAVVPAGSSRHGVSCSRLHAAVRQKIHLSQLFRFPEPDLYCFHAAGLSPFRGQ